MGREREHMTETQIPKPCKNCSSRGGKAGKYCTEYLTHVWKASVQCKDMALKAENKYLDKVEFTINAYHDNNEYF